MSINHFSGLSLDEFSFGAISGEDPADRFISRLSEVDRPTDLTITLFWTSQHSLNIKSVQVDEGAPYFRELLSQQQFTRSGRFSTYVGAYPKGSKLRFTIAALPLDDDIPACVIVISTVDEVKQIIPKPSGFGSMQRGTLWVQEGEYSV